VTGDVSDGATAILNSEEVYWSEIFIKRELVVSVIVNLTHSPLHQENSNRVAGLEPDQPDASTLSEHEWRHNTLPIP